MRLLLTFLFALGVLTGTGGRFFAPKPAAAPAPAKSTACSSDTGQPADANSCPRCSPTARHAEPSSTPKLAAEAHPTPHPGGA